MASQGLAPARGVSPRRAAAFVLFGFAVGAGIAMLLMCVFSRRLLDELGRLNDARRFSRAVMLLDGAALVRDGKTVGHLNAGVVLVRSGSTATGLQELTLEFASERTVGPRFDAAGPARSGISTVLLVKEAPLQ
jgi:hypothetical protein